MRDQFGEEIAGLVEGVTQFRNSRLPYLNTTMAENYRTAFPAEIEVDAWDRGRLLEDLLRALAESGARITEVHVVVNEAIVNHRFVTAVHGGEAINGIVNRLRAIDSVLDVYGVLRRWTGHSRTVRGCVGMDDRELTPAERAEIERLLGIWLRRVRTALSAYNDATTRAVTAERRHGVPAVILSALVATSVFATLEADPASGLRSPPASWP